MFGGHTSQINIGQSCRKNVGEKAFTITEDKRTAVGQEMLQILRTERYVLVINTQFVSEQYAELW